MTQKLHNYFLEWCHELIRLSRLRLQTTQPSIPSGLVNEYQLRLGRQRQVLFIPLADVQVKL